MSDLTEILPQDSATVRAIYNYWKKRGDSEPKRGYLGASAIGAPCERQLWYSFRDCTAESFEGRLYRLFNRGHLEEPRFVEELKGIGCEVHEVGPDGKQFEIALFGGHFKGHCDGVALGIPEAPNTWHLLEMKTSNTKDFNKLKQEGVEKFKPQHFDQMQIYMAELGLDRALYLAVCKETDELYTERVRKDSKAVQRIKDRAERVIFSNTPPERISEKSDFYLCKWCAAQDLCHNQGDSALPVPALSCRQCCHASPERDGTWTCAKGNAFGTVCEHHLTLPGLIDWADPTDSMKNDDGSDVIEFTAKTDGSVFVHGSKAISGQYSSRHLAEMPRDLLLWPQVENLKKPDGTVQPNLESKWSTTIDGIEVAWTGKAAEITDVWPQHVDFPMSNPIFTQDTETYNAADFGSACAIIYANGSAEIRIDTNQ